MPRWLLFESKHDVSHLLLQVLRRVQEDLELVRLNQVRALRNLLDKLIQQKHPHLVVGRSLTARSLLFGQRRHVEPWELENEAGSKYGKVSESAHNIKHLLGFGVCTNQPILVNIASLYALPHIETRGQLYSLVQGCTNESTITLGVVAFVDLLSGKGFRHTMSLVLGLRTLSS